MSEESENSGGGSLKSILIGLASTIALGVGGYVTKQLTGESDEPAQAVTATAPVINITNSNQAQQQVASGGKTIIINKGGNGTAAQGTSVVAPKPKPKKESDEFTEKPAAW